MRVVGIDPGKKGAVVTVEIDDRGARVVRCFRGRDYTAQATKTRRDYDLPEMERVLRVASVGAGLVALEKQGPRRTDGRVQAFYNGEGWGLWQAFVARLGVPWRVVLPVEWKRAMLSGLRGDKGLSIRACSQLFPGFDLKPGKLQNPHDGLAEAALIALYGSRWLTGASA